MSDRGEYRPWYVAITDDADFQSMAGDVFKLLFVLKMTLPASGIGVIHMLVTAERCGCSVEDLTKRLDILAVPKPDSPRGWIVRDRNIVWIVNGLENEQGLSPNSPHHRTFIVSTLRPLGEKQIVRDFRAYYAAWFDDIPAVPSAMDEPGAERGSDGGLAGVSDHYNQQPTTENREPRTKQVVVDARELSNVLTTRLNQGMRDNPAIGEGYQPVPHGHAPSLAAATDIAAAGVPADFASDRVYIGAKKYKPTGRNRQINSLSYLATGVISDWEKEQARVAANGAVRPASKSNGKGFTTRAMKLVGLIRDRRNPLFPNSVVAAWQTGLSNSDIQVCKTFGLTRILNDQNEGTMVAQLTKALEESSHG